MDINSARARLPVILLPLAFFGLVYLTPLNGGWLWMPDETRYAEISREMIASGDWMTPRLLGLRYFEKPVAGYWVNSLSQTLFGHNNFSVRFGAAASTGVSAALVFALAFALRRRKDQAACASLIYLSMLLVCGIGTFAVLDPILTMWMSAAMFIAYLTGRAQSVRERLMAWLGLGLACGLGVMTKGFLVPGVVFLAMLPVAVRERRYKEFLLYGPSAVLACIAVCLPWGLAIAAREPDFWNYFFWVEHIQRFGAGNEVQHKEPLWYYLPVLIAGCIPWLGLLPGALRHGWKNRAPGPELFFLLSWLVMPFAFFSLASGKLPTYILPCMAPLALLLARYGLDRPPGAERAFKINGIINICVGAAGFIAIGVFMSGLLPEPILRPQDWPKIGLAAVIMAAWIACGCLSMRRQGKFWLLAAACPMLLIMLQEQIIPEDMRRAKEPQRFVREHLAEIEDCRFIMANTAGLAPAVAWETRRSDIFLTDSPGELEYGVNYPDARGRLVKEKDIDAWVAQMREEGQVALLMRLEKKIELLDELTPPDKLEAAAPFYLLIYKQHKPEEAQP